MLYYSWALAISRITRSFGPMNSNLDRLVHEEFHWKGDGRDVHQMELMNGETFCGRERIP